MDSNAPEYSNSAIVFGNLKEALLYFEYVVPANLAGSFLGLTPQQLTKGNVMENLGGMPEERELNAAFPNPEDVLRLCPPRLAEHPQFRHALEGLDCLVYSFLVKQILGTEGFAEYLRNLQFIRARDSNRIADFVSIPDNVAKLAERGPTSEFVTRFFKHFLEDFAIKNMAIDCSNFLSDTPTHPGSTSITLTGLPLIDVSGVPMSDILEFRKDKEVMRKMREFRLFAYNNYQGKSRTFVEDDLSQRLDAYGRAVKTLGLKTRNKNLTFLLKSKSVMAAGAATLYSLISNSPDSLVTIGGLAALGWKMLDFTIELSNQKNDFLNLSEEHPVSYIEEAKEKLKPVERD